MRMRHYVYLVLIIFGSLTSLQAQIIRGVVKDSVNNDAIIGATIVEIDKNNRFLNGTVTDVNGNFSLKVSSDEVKLGISYIGYSSKEIMARTGISYSIDLSPRFEYLEEIVVVAEAKNAGDGLTTTPIRNLATSVSTIEMTELAALPTSSVAEALQGRMSGVDISSTSGDPGAGMSIKIRGSTSLNGNSQPLIVLDGVPYETTIGSDFNFLNADVADYGSLVDISPADIRSIQVLKDAAATAVWGSRGANGVIVIATKRGRSKKTKFDLDYRSTFKLEPTTLPMLNGDQYVRLMQDELFNRNPVGLSDIPDEYYNDPSSPDYYNFNNNTDWVDAVSRNGYSQELNFSIAGAGDKARYRTSVGYLNETGTTIGTGLTRLTTRLNLDYNISDKLLLSTEVSYAHNNKDRNYFDGEGVSEEDRRRQVRSIAYVKAPHMAIYEHDENGNKTGNYFSPVQPEQGRGIDYPNPVALANDGINNDEKNRVLTNFKLDYELIDGLTYSATVAFDIASNTNTNYLPQSATGVQSGNSELNKTRTKEDLQNIIQTFNKLIYNPYLGGNHELNILGMFSTYDKYSSQMSLSTAGIPSGYLTGPTNNGSNDNAKSAKSKIRTLSYLLTGHYTFLDRYIISGSIRIDGDSRFGPNNRYGYFPSLSGAWRISSENFMSGFSWLSDLKLRASYGKNGFPTEGSYAYLAKYQSATGYMDMNGIQLGNVQLNNLKWETTEQTNYGFDLSMFSYRVKLNFDYYEKYTKDIIFSSVKIPSTTGFSSSTGNWGAMSNRGWETSLNIKVLSRQDLNIDVNFNFSRNKNIIEKIPENYATETFSVDNGSYARRIQEGNPIGTFYGFRYLGVFANPEDAVAHDADGNVIINPQTGEPLPYLINGSTASAGDANYEDINHDGNIDELDIVYLGDANPKFFGGFGFNIAYKQLVINTFFDYKYGQDVINGTRMITENMYTTNNQSTAVLRRWRKNGDVTDIPRAVRSQGRNWLGSDRFVEDASYMRLKSVTLSYNLTSDRISQAGLESIRMFATAYNILTLTKYTGQNPDVGFNGSDPFEIGRDWSRTPPAVSITAGVNLVF